MNGLGRCHGQQAVVVYASLQREEIYSKLLQKKKPPSNSIKKIGLLI